MLANFFCKRLDSKYFRHWPYSFYLCLQKKKKVCWSWSNGIQAHTFFKTCVWSKKTLLLARFVLCVIIKIGGAGAVNRECLKRKLSVLMIGWVGQSCWGLEMPTLLQSKRQLHTTLSKCQLYFHWEPLI